MVTAHNVWIEVNRVIEFKTISQNYLSVIKCLDAINVFKKHLSSQAHQLKDLWIFLTLFSNNGP